jgi:hypothetical protein
VVIKLTKIEKNTIMLNKRSAGACSSCSCVKPQKQGFKDVICEVCDKVFTTDKDIYICPECQEKSKNSRQ